jgi:RNA polymerase II C-terminal domain phosphatase-like 3/4
MHVYTLGRQDYAKAVIDLLDPEGVYFGGRVVSRKESTQWDMKSLDVIPGADPAAVVILDDTDSACPGHQDNLILMDRYHYFSSTCRKFGYDIPFPSLAEQSRDEREQDCSLAVVLGVLERIHKAFFDGDRADVRDVIRDGDRAVVPGRRARVPGDRPCELNGVTSCGFRVPILQLAVMALLTFVP